jgi:hypothetical protein
MLFNPPASIDVLFCGLAKSKYVVDVRLAMIAMLRHSKSKFLAL